MRGIHPLDLNSLLSEAFEAGNMRPRWHRGTPDGPCRGALDASGRFRVYSSA